MIEIFFISWNSILAVPITYRCDVGKDGRLNMSRLLGHPNILYLPDTVHGDLLYNYVEHVIPSAAVYSLVLTDGQVTPSGSRFLIILMCSKSVCFIRCNMTSQ